MLGLRDEVDAFLGSDEWVDLLEVVRAQLVTGRSMGLKETAPMAGFAWRFDDAGGTLAMVKYDEAVVDDEDGRCGVPGGRRPAVDPRLQRGRRAGHGRAARLARRRGECVAVDRGGLSVRSRPAPLLGQLPMRPVPPIE